MSSKEEWSASDISMLETMLELTIIFHKNIQIAHQDFNNSIFDSNAESQYYFEAYERSANAIKCFEILIKKLKNDSEEI